MRVLVCRPRAEGEATARRLVARGHEPVLAPVLVVETFAVALPPAHPDALVVTSAQALPSLEPADVERLRHRPLFAVGAATARAARARGFGDVRTGAGDAADLADLIRLTLRPGASLLYLAGRVRKPGLEEALRERGDRVDLRVAYDARPNPAWPPEVNAALRAGSLDACLHFSQRSAMLALAAAEAGGGTAPFIALRHACLSEDAAAPLVAAGGDVVVAARPDEASLLQAL